MATFYPQLLSNESLSQQWQRYLRDKPFINNVEDIIQNQTREYKNIIEELSREQGQAIQASTEAVCGTLDSGFELLSGHLEELSYGISEVRSELNGISSILDWGFSSLIEDQKISNLLLGNIGVLLRIPDFQKERQDYIQKGLKFLKNAFFDNSLYDNSLKYFLKAEETEPEDYFVLNRIGRIYMFSLSHYDLNKCEEYFKKASKYAIVETNSKASVSANYLTSDLNKDLLSQIPTLDSIKLQAAESYMFAGRSCYLQGKFTEAAELAGRAFALVPQMVEAGFVQAQALSADNKASQSAKVLKSVIEKDRFYSIKTIRDLDLRTKTEIKDLLEKLRQDSFANASKMLFECKSNIIPESIIKGEISIIEKLVKRKSYLHCKKAIDIANKNVERTFSDMFQTSNKNTYNVNNNLSELQNELFEISRKTKYPEQNIRKIKTLFDYLSQNTQWDFPKISTMSDVVNFGSGYEPKKMTSILTTFVKKEKEYFEKLSSAKSQIKKVIREIYIDDNNRRIADTRELAEQEKATQKTKNSASLRYAISNAGSFGVSGLVLGAIIGFRKGCISYSAHVNMPVSEPFRYISGSALTFCVIGTILGIIMGVIKGQK